MMKGFVVVALLLLQCACCVHSSRHRRLDRRVDSMVSSSGFIVEPTSQNWPQRDLNLRSSSSCNETCGFMPGTPSAVENLFLLLGYGYLMYKSVSLMANGCDRLLVVMGDGVRHRIIRGLLLPNFGSFTDIALILVFGLFGSKETAQGKVMIGMGLIAGSTILLLTLLWGACLIVGKHNISEDHSIDIDGRDTRGFNLYGSGIIIDEQTDWVSRIMVCSVIPFIILNLRTFIHSSSGKRITDLVACVTALIILLSYYIYQVSQPWILEIRQAYAKHKQLISAISKVVRKKGYGKPDNEVFLRIFKTIFKELDQDNDGYLSKRELRGLIIGIEWQDPQATTTDNARVDQVMEKFNSSRDDQLSEEEFTNGMSSWFDFRTSTVDQSANYEVYLKAVLLILGGVILAVIIADPFVDAVGKFSDATGIPSFFISFLILPLATKSSEGVLALKIVSQKKKRSTSLTYAEIYGAVIINNTLFLALILAIAYIRGLDWDFSAEMLVVVLVNLVMGLLINNFHTTYPLWTSFIAFLLYVLSLAIFYVRGNWS